MKLLPCVFAASLIAIAAGATSCTAGYFLSGSECKKCSNEVCEKDAEHSPDVGAKNQWSDFLTGIRTGTCNDTMGDGYRCQQKNVVGQAGASTGAAGISDGTLKACYRNHGTKHNKNQRSNVAACKVICDATQEAAACKVVSDAAAAKWACQEGYARKDGSNSTCEECTTDDDFEKYNGCNVDCSHIKCEHKTHTCAAQGLYANTADDNKEVKDMSTSRNFYRAKYANFAAPNAVTPHTTAESSCNSVATIVTTHPGNNGTHYSPFTGAHLDLTKTHKRYGLYEIMCTKGHACRNEADGKCHCRPTHKPYFFQSSGN